MKHPDRGIHYGRTRTEDPEHVNRERVFAEAWERENVPQTWLNFGMGLLQDLMVTRRPAKAGDLSVPSEAAVLRPHALRVAFKVTARERVIVATAIQWLGTGCGFSWLIETLERCGYEVRRIERKEDKAA